MLWSSASVAVIVIVYLPPNVSGGVVILRLVDTFVYPVNSKDVSSNSADQFAGKFADRLYVFVPQSILLLFYTHTVQEILLPGSILSGSGEVTLTIGGTFSRQLWSNLISTLTFDSAPSPVFPNTLIATPLPGSQNILSFSKYE